MNYPPWPVVYSAVIACTVSVAFARDSGLTRFEGLNIPKEYVVHAPNDSPRGIYDDQDFSILLSFTKKELSKYIPLWETASAGNNEQSFIIHRSQLNLLAGIANLSSDALEDPPKYVADSKLKGVQKLNLTHGRWLLFSNTSEKYQFLALCRQSIGINGQFDECTFKTNLAGFGISYRLKDSEIYLVDEFSDFIVTKIDEWKKVD